jgi:hypothetical protein
VFRVFSQERGALGSVGTACLNTADRNIRADRPATEHCPATRRSVPGRSAGNRAMSRDSAVRTGPIGRQQSTVPRPGGPDRADRPATEHCPAIRRSGPGRSAGNRALSRDSAVRTGPIGRWSASTLRHFAATEPGLMSSVCCLQRNGSPTSIFRDVSTGLGLLFESRPLFRQ